jgi:transglutaminase-like putative cysteine protease
MHFDVVHITHYQYSAPVRLAPHLLRLTPRSGGIDLLEHHLSIDPEPDAASDEQDADGNTLTWARFDAPTDHLRIESRFAVWTRVPTAPTALGIPPLPWSPGPDDSLKPYRPQGEIDAAVAAFARQVAAEANWFAPAFLERLNRTLCVRTNRKIRLDGAARPACETLARQEVACRDLTVLFMDACRSLGIAARFVSGYRARTGRSDGDRHLHAWPEAFLPGAGWVGYDPTHGTRVADAHVALCSGADRSGTMPLEGGYFGDGVTMRLDYDIRISTAP